jgi:hypothetical protein
MTAWQKVTIAIWGTIHFLLFIKGFYESNKKKNAYGLTILLFPFGIFVWGDAVIFGLFWTLSSIATLLLKDWILFLLFISVFWLVRSAGETIYWFNQQFSPIKRNPPETLPLYKFFHNDSIWFIYQISMQCICVISIIFSIYFAHLWLG